MVIFTVSAFLPLCNQVLFAFVSQITGKVCLIDELVISDLNLLRLLSALEEKRLRSLKQSAVLVTQMHQIVHFILASTTAFIMVFGRNKNHGVVIFLYSLEALNLAPL